jgi:hypothetical protein
MQNPGSDAGVFVGAGKGLRGTYSRQAQPVGLDRLYGSQLSSYSGRIF